tara:strand:- start:9101 stop:9703 length:603 start_codon:yes stop_codon:yes gene_type:complete
MAEIYNQEAVDALVNAGKPIPGQSLTNDPDQRYPWESPPEYTDYKQALNFIADQLLDKEVYVPLMKGIGAGVPITDITLQMLQAGFEQGKWNPDLLMMLIEPTVYTLMALAEKANIQYRINGDEEEDMDEDDEKDIQMMKQKNLQELVTTKVSQESKVPSGVVPREILQQIDNMEMPESLLSREEPQQQEEESLLARGER